MMKKVMSVILTLCLALTMIPAATSSVFADSSSASVFVKQEGSGKCTLASAVMLIRQTAIRNGETNWSEITQSSLKSTAWLEGAGLLHSFSWHGIKVSYQNMPAENRKDELIRLLDKHPEGIVIYIRSIPHAVLLTRYDASNDVLYCADPALSTSEMKLENSWMRKVKSGSVQDEIAEAVDCYWYVSSCKYTPLTGSEIKGDDPVTEKPDNGNTVITPDPVPDSKPDIHIIQFAKVNTYNGNQFKDIKSSDWYYEYTKTAYELGLMNGSDSKFNPKGNITLAQTITIAARIHSLYHKNGYDFSMKQGEAWYQPYVDYAYTYGIIGDKYKKMNMNASAARLEFAEILSKSLPSEALAEINEASSGVFPDVSSVSEAGRAVYKLYKAGILTGSSDGKFHPANSISRAEAAAILSRMADSTQRVKQ